MNPPVAQDRLNLIVRISGGLLFLAGVLVLGGWVLDIPGLQQVFPGGPKMAPITAVAFLIAATALICAEKAQTRKAWRGSMRVLAGMLGLIGGFRLCAFLFGWEFDVDSMGFGGELAADGKPVEMALATALTFLLISAALLLPGSSRSAAVSQVLVLLSALFSWLAVAGYFYGGQPLAAHAEMSVFTAVCLQVLCLGTFCTRRDGGLMALLLSDTAGGSQARRLLLPTVLIPPVFAGLALAGHRAELFDVETGLLLLASACLTLSAAFIWGNSEVLHRADLKRLQAERRMEASFRQVKDLETALDEHAIVGITDPQGRITYANDKFCEISKYPREELLGRDHRILNSGYHSKEFFQDLWTTISHDRVWHGEICNKAKDGSIYWVDATIVPFLNEQGKPRQYVAIRADITARKRMEIELENLNAELEQRVRTRTVELEATNKELEAFSYSISHDLRAPLRAVNGFAEILFDDFHGELPVEARGYLERIRDGARRMSALIDDLLKFSRLSRQPLRHQPVDMLNLVECALQETESERKDRRVDVTLGALPPCSGDPVLLKQVWVNLLSNAIKYTRGRDPAVLEIGCDSANGGPVYFIRDNGAGFDMQHSGRLFGVFQRLHRADEFEGTGVGLAIVQRIVHRHGGRVWAEARLNQGATFFLTLGPHGNGGDV